MALDLGAKRVGVAIAGDVARLAKPLTTLTNDAALATELKALIQEHDVTVLVAGLPRGMQGQATAQTASIQEMGEELAKQLQLKVHWQDEALTSHQAEQELRTREVRYNKAAVDALAACLILEDFLRNHSQTNHGKV